MEKFSAKDQIERFLQDGTIITSDGSTSTHGFWDWFCKESSLEKKGQDLMKKAIRFLAKHPEIDPSMVYLWFKNNCPMVGPLYDDFRIADIETGDIIFTVVPKSPRGMTEVWGIDNSFKGPILTSKNFKGILEPI